MTIRKLKKILESYPDDVEIIISTIEGVFVIKGIINYSEKHKQLILDS